MTTQSPIARKRKDYSHIKPLPDPPKEPDMRQNDVLMYTFPTLQAYFAGREDVLLGGGGYIVREPGQGIRGAFAPDLVFTEGVEDPWLHAVRLNGYIISVVGKPPDFVLEVASASTGRNDYTVKRDGYAALDVPEYWRFDPSGGRFHDAPLAGDALVDRRYEPLPITTEPDGSHWGFSPILGLELVWVQERLDEDGVQWGILRFRNPATGEFLPEPREQELARRTAETLASEAETRAYFAESQAQRERAARIAAEEQAQAERIAAQTRIAEMEAELRRLRGK